MHIARQVRLDLSVISLSLAVVATPLWAAGYARMFNDTGLTPQDVEMAQAAAQSLYTKQGVAKGETAKWSNAQSGASGQVEVVETGGTPRCVVYRHETQTANNQTTRVDYRRCRNAQGKWELSP